MNLSNKSVYRMLIDLNKLKRRLLNVSFAKLGPEMIKLDGHEH